MAKTGKKKPTCLKIKIFHVTKDNIDTVKRQVTAREEKAAVHTQQRIQIQNIPISYEAVRRQAAA